MNMMTALPRPSRPPSNDDARRSLRFRKLVSLFERDEIEAGVEALISYLDARSGAPNGDELDGASVFLDRAEDYLPGYGDDAKARTGEDDEDCGAEDDFTAHFPDGPGCPLADPDICVEHADLSSAGGDISYAEWHTLAASRRRAGAIDGKSRSHWGEAVAEDAELNGDEFDHSHAEDEAGFASWPSRGAGCPIADPGGCQHDGREPENER